MFPPLLIIGLTNSNIWDVGVWIYGCSSKQYCELLNADCLQYCLVMLTVAVHVGLIVDLCNRHTRVSVVTDDWLCFMQQCLMLSLLTCHIVMQQCLGLLSSLIHCKPGIFATAGTKDKRAVTVQHVTAFKVAHFFFVLLMITMVCGCLALFLLLLLPSWHWLVLMSKPSLCQMLPPLLLCVLPLILLPSIFWQSMH